MVTPLQSQVGALACHCRLENGRM